MKFKELTISFGIVVLIIISFIIIYKPFHEKQFHVSVAGQDMENLTLIQRLQFIEIPNETLVQNCFREYENVSGQKYWVFMSDCIGNITEYVVYDIPRINITKDILDKECTCEKEKKEGCVEYYCLNQKVRYKY